jgi:DNA polymerase III sliding clamp (beta) subunit (PCNA family)
MQFKKAELLEILAKVKPGLAQKDIVEQFTHFIFSGTEVVTYNDQICISHPLETDFHCSAKADDFYKMIKGVKEDTVEVSLVNEKLVIQSGKTKGCLSTTVEAKAEELVKLLALPGLEEHWAPLPEDFLSGIFLTMFGASRDMTKGILTCIQVKDDNLISSDEVRISHYRMKTPFEHSVLIPRSSAGELVKFPVVKFVFEENWAHFCTEANVTFSTRIQSGDYPDVVHFIDSMEGDDLTLPPELREVVDSVYFMTDGEVDLDRRITVRATQDTLMVKAEKDIGWVEKTIDFKMDRDTIAFDINPQMFSQVLEKATKMLVATNAALFESGTFRHLVALPE